MKKYIQETFMQVAKWGNSLAVRLPKALVDALGLKEGDEIEIRAVDRATFEASKSPTVEEILADIRKYRGAIPADYKWNRRDAYDED
ncbi:MAG: AbrB/MazE/SpoVT family DNA-binding domain-containing protein [Xanthobacteraceae bacterium]